MAVNGFKNAVWNQLNYTQGQILTTKFIEDGAISANGEKSERDLYGPLNSSTVFSGKIH